jgi:ribosome biogenesis GTPase / thiamine phosphate phosphatase
LKREKHISGKSRKPVDPSGSNTVKEGLIIAHHGVSVEVLFSDGLRSRIGVKRRSGHVVGDRVQIENEVLDRLPRRTELQRRDARGAVHLVGANLDVLGVVVAMLPVPPPGFIDRAIVAARAADLHPFVVVNKCDLAGSHGLVSSLESAYAGSVPVFSLSAVVGNGLDPVLDFLKDKRGAFVGITGVGKSSLLNALCPGIDLKVGEIGSISNRGRHTTTVSTLHALASGGELIDTPGFQDFGLVDISAEDLAAYFPGFENTGESACRFRDCRHRTEPGCAVTNLVASGLVSTERYETYLELLTEVQAGEAEARRREWKK